MAEDLGKRSMRLAKKAPFVVPMSVSAGLQLVLAFLAAGTAAMQPGLGDEWAEDGASPATGKSPRDGFEQEESSPLRMSQFSGGLSEIPVISPEETQDS